MILILGFPSSNEIHLFGCYSFSISLSFLSFEGPFKATGSCCHLVWHAKMIEHLENYIHKAPLVHFQNHPCKND